MVIKITPEPTFLPVMAMEAISELPALPVLTSIQWHHIVVASYTDMAYVCSLDEYFIFYPETFVFHKSKPFVDFVLK